MRYQRFNAPDIENVDQDQIEEFITAAREHYSDRLPYHNWDHATATIEGVDKIADKLAYHNITIARNTLRIAAAWHDAGYHENHSVRGFTTKEDYSAALLDEYMKDKPVNSLARRLMRSAILATWSIHPALRTPTEMILHRADTANIGGPADEFIEKNALLFKEAQRGGFSLSWSDHVTRTDRFVRLLVAEHDHESLLQNVQTEDPTVDVHDEAFRDAAFRNLDVLYRTNEPKASRQRK